MHAEIIDFQQVYQLRNRRLFDTTGHRKDVEVIWAIAGKDPRGCYEYCTLAMEHMDEYLIRPNGLPMRQIGKLTMLEERLLVLGDFAKDPRQFFADLGLSTRLVRDKDASVEERFWCWMPVTRQWVHGGYMNPGSMFRRPKLVVEEIYLSWSYVETHQTGGLDFDIERLHHA